MWPSRATIHGKSNVKATNPTVLKVTSSQARQRLASLVEGASRGKSRVLIERSGVPVAAIVSAEDLARLARLDDQDQRAWEVLEAMRAPFRDVPAEEIEREADKAVAAVRARRRADRERAKETAAMA